MLKATTETRARLLRGVCFALFLFLLFGFSPLRCCSTSFRVRYVVLSGLMKYLSFLPADLPSFLSVILIFHPAGRSSFFSIMILVPVLLLPALLFCLLLEEVEPLK